VCLLLAAGEPETEGDDPTRGWGRVARGGCEVYPFAGDHFSFLREPQVRAVAAKITSLLDSEKEET
jgi:thioesterase domain-containing protein